MSSLFPDKPDWSSIAAHLKMLAAEWQQPFTPADVERAYALLFLPFLDYELPAVRPRLFRLGLTLAIEKMSDPEERVVCRHFLLSEARDSLAERRRHAADELAGPPYNLGRAAKAEALARREERAFDNLALILASQAFAEEFRTHYAGRVNLEPPPTPPPRAMRYLSYAQIATLQDDNPPFLRKLISIRARSELERLRVIALPFRWIREGLPSEELYPKIDVVSDKHSFLGIKPDPRTNSREWLAAVFHLGAPIGFGNTFKLVYKETWLEFPPNAQENNLAFRVGDVPLDHVHLSARLPKVLQARRFRGRRWDTNEPEPPTPAEEIRVQVYRSGATLHVAPSAVHSRYAVEWVDARARPMVE